MSNIHYQLEAKRKRQAKYDRWMENLERLDAEDAANQPSWIEYENALPYRVGCWPVLSSRRDKYDDFYLNHLSEEFIEGKHPGLAKHSCGHIHPIEYHYPIGNREHKAIVYPFLTLSGPAARYAVLDKDRRQCLQNLAKLLGVDYKDPPICCGVRHTPFVRHSYAHCPERLYRLFRIDQDLHCLQNHPEMFLPSSRSATLNCGDTTSCKSNNNHAKPTFY